MALRIFQTKGPWELAVIGTNLTDAVVIYPETLGKPLGVPDDLLGGLGVGLPRQVSLQATYRF